MKKIKPNVFLSPVVLRPLSFCLAVWCFLFAPAYSQTPRRPPITVLLLSCYTGTAQILSQPLDVHTESISTHSHLVRIPWTAITVDSSKCSFKRLIKHCNILLLTILALLSLLLIAFHIFSHPLPPLLVPPPRSLSNVCTIVLFPHIFLMCFLHDTPFSFPAHFHSSLSFLPILIDLSFIFQSVFPSSLTLGRSVCP